MLLSTNSGIYSARPGKPRFDMINETIDFVVEAGFEAIDVNFCAVIYGAPYNKKVHEPVLDTPDGILRLKEKLDASGLAVNTGHLPYFNYAKKDAPNYDYYQEWMYKSLDATAELGIKWTVIHTNETAEITADYIRPFCEFGNKRGVGIAIENSSRYSLDEMIGAIDILTGEGYKVGCCFDTGHANFAGLPQGETLRKIGDRLKMLHVHDNYGDRDAHQLPLAGNIDWNDTMRTLAQIGYTGDFNYELNPANIPESARRSHAAYAVDLARWLLSIYDDELRSMAK